MDEPHIARIRIYPVKSLDPIEVTEAEMGIHSLKHDREFAMVAMDGRYVNGKRTGRVNQLKAAYDLDQQLITLGPRDGEESQTFELREGNALLNEYLSDFFDIKLLMIHRSKGELMDIPKASSITVVSEASLQSLQKDLEKHELEELRLRFRANIELGGVGAYWEEQLFHLHNTGVRFSMGDVQMVGISPRARCNVPPQNPYTGEPDRGFARKMMKSRSESLPEDSLLPMYGSMYHLTVNTYLPESERGKRIYLGDPIQIGGAVPLQSKKTS